jgi:hypothetical protein
MSRNRLFFLFVLVCLLTALAPLSDFDLDGNLDSLITEGLVLTPLIGFISGLFSLWLRLPVAFLAVSQQFFSLIVPPPIDNR